MPKVKSVSGAKKRFRKTASGKFKLNHANKSHILTKKTTKRLRKLRRGMMADHANLGALKRMLPYA